MIILIKEKIIYMLVSGYTLKEVSAHIHFPIYKIREIVAKELDKELKTGPYIPL